MKGMKVKVTKYGSRFTIYIVRTILKHNIDANTTGIQEEEFVTYCTKEKYR